jgi:hypothetical protein
VITRNALQAKLYELSSAGWTVAGFTHTVGGTSLNDGVCSETDGYSILLRKDGHIAIAYVSHRAGKVELCSVDVITGEVDR